MIIRNDKKYPISGKVINELLEALGAHPLGIKLRAVLSAQLLDNKAIDLSNIEFDFPKIYEILNHMCDNNSDNGNADIKDGHGWIDIGYFECDKFEKKMNEVKPLKIKE